VAESDGINKVKDVLCSAKSSDKGDSSAGHQW